MTSNKAAARSAGSSPKPARKRKGIAAIQSVSNAREDLAAELYAIIRLALKEFGLTSAQQNRAIARAKLVKASPRVSGPMLRDAGCLGALLNEWSSAEPYVDTHGRPRVLAIDGPGATFETLARRFLPGKPVNEVTKMACAFAEVVTRPGNTIALLGNVLVNVGAQQEGFLAHAIRQVDRLLQTILHNAQINIARVGFNEGHMERVVKGVIARSALNGFLKEFRPQIYDLLERVDASIRERQPRSLRSLSGATAVSISVYLSQDDDLEREGADESFLTSRLRSGMTKQRGKLTPKPARRFANAARRKTKR
jgi:hypothetical protein